MANLATPSFPVHHNLPATSALSMNGVRRILGSILLLILLPIGAGAQTDENDWEEISEGERLFALVVQPTLQSKCAACHGQEEEAIESGLVITGREALLRGGDSGETVLVPGKRDASWLYLSATWKHDQLQMPPKENDRLDAQSLEALGQWIDAGAPWPAPDRVAQIRQRLSTGVTVATSGGLDSGWDQRRYQPETLWAYQPLEPVDLPPATRHVAANAVDLFINEQLDALSIAPAPRADRRTLVRRLYFDLLGLPPSPADVAQFVSDPRPDEIAWQQLVDRLLASPRLGEQWARHWLDTVRYADSAGFANDYTRPNAWRYRDYVVRCLNEDRPLNQFITEQIAGDEIDPDDPEALIAVGMLRMGPWEQTGMSVDKVTRQQFLDDVTDVVGQTFLAHPLQCARCHDHKFDPIPTRDYYRIQAVFATTQFAERDAPILVSENSGVFDQQANYLKTRIRHYETILNKLNAKEKKAARKWYADRGLSYAPRNEKQKAGVPDDEIAPRKIGFQPSDFGAERIARKYLERHRWELDRYRGIALSVYTGPTPSRRNVHSRIRLPNDISKSGTVENTSILTGGDPFSPSTSVTPGVLSMLTGVVSSENTRQKSSVTREPEGRRSEFAAWLTDPQRNPLTPRVMVNRIWQHHFGAGLVTTPNNFGTAGAKPTHPELLDFLAGELLRSGWSTKRIHRMILTSEAYCRSQKHPRPDRLREKDPGGSAYAVFSARRLSAEELRDSTLAISGLLNHEMGGAPIRPDINAEVAVQPRQIMGTYAPIYQASPLPQDRHRRTLYALRLRGLRDPMLEVFNQPSPDLPCESRDSSTVAPQALTLLNSPLSYNRALAMAERLLHEQADRSPESGRTPMSDPEVIERAFALAYGRQATLDEQTACLDHWQAMQSRHQSIQLSDVTPPTEVTRQMVDENTGEMFSFTELLEQNQDYLAEVTPSTASPRARGLAEVCLILLASNELLYVP